MWEEKIVFGKWVKDFALTSKGEIIVGDMLGLLIFIDQETGEVSEKNKVSGAQIMGGNS